MQAKLSEGLFGNSLALRVGLTGFRLGCLAIRRLGLGRLDGVDGAGHGGDQIELALLRIAQLRASSGVIPSSR